MIDAIMIMLFVTETSTKIKISAAPVDKESNSPDLFSAVF